MFYVKHCARHNEGEKGKQGIPAFSEFTIKWEKQMCVHPFGRGKIVTANSYVSSSVPGASDKPPTLNPHTA